MSIEKAIRTFILENFLFTDDGEALKNSDSFLTMGIVDSTGIMEVIFFIEEEFGISVSNDEMVPENLDSVSNLVAFIACFALGAAYLAGAGLWTMIAVAVIAIGMVSRVGRYGAGVCSRITSVCASTAATKNMSSATTGPVIGPSLSTLSLWSAAISPSG